VVKKYSLPFVDYIEKHLWKWWSGNLFNYLYWIFTIHMSNQQEHNVTKQCSFIQNKWADPPREVELIRSEPIKGCQTHFVRTKEMAGKSGTIKWPAKNRIDKIIQYFPHINLVTRLPSTGAASTELRWPEAKPPSEEDRLTPGENARIRSQSYDLRSQRQRC
jgi:hypothetical protein